MTYYVFKLAITAGLIVAISEIAKRSTFLGGLIASLPIISLFSILWIYIDTGDTGSKQAKAVQYGCSIVGVRRCPGCVYSCSPRDLREREARPPFVCPDCGEELYYDEQ